MQLQKQHVPLTPAGAQFLTYLSREPDLTVMPLYAGVGAEIVFNFASLWLRPTPDGFYLYSFEAWPRRERHGSTALSTLCLLADATGVVLTLHVQPYGIDPMPKGKLYKWYRSFGFRGTHMLTRRPGCKENSGGV